MRRAVAICATCLTLLSAFAMTSSATTVELHDGLLAIEDSDGVANVLDVRQISLVEYEVYDEAGMLSTGTGCGLLTEKTARCAGQALSVQVDAGPGDDLVGLWGIRVPVRLMGSDGDDGLAGGTASDQLWGGGGNDSLTGDSGEDRVSGEDGDDFADGDGGADTVLGGGGDDILDGRAGSGDVVSGGAGRDLAYGGPGDDQLDGGDGDDTLIGGAGRDTISTGLGQDDVFGGGGRVNKIDCRAGDRVRGEAGRLAPGCASLPAAERKPVEWPPPERTAATRSQTPTYKVFGKPVRKGDARKYWVWAGAPANVHRRVRVRVKLRRGDTVLRRRCHKKLWTNREYHRSVPSKARSMTRLTGKVRVGKRCP